MKKRVDVFLDPQADNGNVGGVFDKRKRQQGAVGSMRDVYVTSSSNIVVLAKGGSLCIVG